MRILNRFALMSSALLLASCSALNPFASKPKNSPAPLTTFKQSMAVRTVWSASVGRSGDYVFTPAYVNGRLYAANEAGEVSCIEASSGKLVWKISAGMKLTSGVAADASMVVVAGADGVVQAFDAASGEKRWPWVPRPQDSTSPVEAASLLIMSVVTWAPACAAAMATSRLKSLIFTGCLLYRKYVVE